MMHGVCTIQIALVLAGALNNMNVPILHQVRLPGKATALI